ncbi:MAG: NAD(+)/NADH kinase, partial [Deltaproteobacteria bacterium]
MKKVGLVVKPDKAVQARANMFEAWLSQRSMEVVRNNISSHDPAGNRDPISTAPSDLFCVFVLGGDGTFLNAVRWVGNTSTPVLGVKFGEVGFLADTTESRLTQAAESVLEGKFTTVARMRLLVTVLRGETETTRETILNDVVINRGALARLAHVQTYIDDQFLTEYRADGLIIATPTGSTAYSLAAGGPIVHPAVDSILLSPICPFTLTNRPLIVPADVCIKLKLAQGASDIFLTFDGQ